MCNPLYVPHMLLYKHTVKKERIEILFIVGRMFCHVGRCVWNESVSDISETVTLNTFSPYIQVDPPIRGFSIRGFSYPRFTAARKKFGKLRK